MEPRFSYWSVLGIILWCMNNIDNTDPEFIMQPPDTPGVLSAMETDLLPSLYACLFMTMHENAFQFIWPQAGAPAGIINAFRTLLRNEYRLDFSSHFRRAVFRYLGPFRASQGGPLPDWAVRAMVGRAWASRWRTHYCSRDTSLYCGRRCSWRVAFMGMQIEFIPEKQSDVPAIQEVPLIITCLVCWGLCKLRLRWKSRIDLQSFV